MLEGYTHSRGGRAEQHSDVDLEFALAVTVQRLKPVLLGFGDVHDGGLDGGLFSGNWSSQATRTRLWLNDHDNDKDFRTAQ